MNYHKESLVVKAMNYHKESLVVKAMNYHKESCGKSYELS